MNHRTIVSASPSRLFDVFARTTVVLVAAVAVTVLTGWFLGIEGLKAQVAGASVMKANTAVGLLVCSLVLWAEQRPAPPAAAVRAAALLVVALGALTLSQEVLRIDLGIDQALVLDRAGVGTTVHPGRMSPASAISFVGLGLALALFRSRAAAAARWLVIVPLFAATLTLIGYLYGVPALYHQRAYSSIAASTAICLLLLALAFLASDTTRGAARIAVSTSAGGVVYRRLLPTIVLILVTVGWVTISGLRHNFYDIEFGLAATVLLSIFVCTVAIASTAGELHRVDGIRRAAEAEITGMNVALERRVQERTRELVELSESLSIANKSLEKLSLHDALTGLANRRFFDVHLGSQVTIARRRGRAMALVLCDVDNFKSYNDLYGHPAGDECLRRIALALRSSCSRPADMSARYGGEEFALILPDTHLSGAAKIAEIARGAVEALAIPHSGTANGVVTLSCGAAVLTRDTDQTSDDLIAAADRNLFEAKNAGRNRVVS